MKSGLVATSPSNRSPVSSRFLFSCTMVLALCVAFPAFGQIHGTPASVTSLGPNGQIHGIPASVTSLGPFGWQVPRRPLPLGSQPRLGQIYGRSRYAYSSGYGATLPYTLPGIVYYDQGSYGSVSASYLDSPPVSGTDPRALAVGPVVAAAPVAAPATATTASLAPPAAAPAPADGLPQTPTVLVFLDGHRLEIANYAIVGDKLHDLTAGRRRVIPLSELDLPATRQVNEDRGNDFLLPLAGGG